MRFRHSPLRSGFAILLATLTILGVVGIRGISAQDATPAPTAGLPEGPLGVQIQWLVDYLNMNPADAEAVDFTTIFTSDVLADVAEPDLKAIFAEIHTQMGTVRVKPDSIATTRDFPATNANFMLVGDTGIELPTSLSVDPDSGLISSVYFQDPILPAATPVASPAASPAASPVTTPEHGLVLPPAAMGEQIQWLLDTVNGTTPVTETDIEAHFSPTFLSTTPASDVVAQIEAARATAPLTVKDNMIITTMDYPPSTGGFVLLGAKGEEFQVGITMDVESGLIRDFVIAQSTGG